MVVWFSGRLHSLSASWRCVCVMAVCEHRTQKEQKKKRNLAEIAYNCLEIHKGCSAYCQRNLRNLPEVCLQRNRLVTQRRLGVCTPVYLMGRGGPGVNKAPSTSETPPPLRKCVFRPWTPFSTVPLIKDPSKQKPKGDRSFCSYIPAIFDYPVIPITPYQFLITPPLHLHIYLFGS